MGDCCRDNRCIHWTGAKGGRWKKRMEEILRPNECYIARRENSPLVPRTPKTEQALREQVLRFAQRLEVRSHLDSYRVALQSIEKDTENARYYLIKLNADENVVRIAGYLASELDHATAEYARAEKEILGKPGQDAVLVSVSSLTALRRAYPNYFADTHVFLQTLKEAVGTNVRLR